MDIFYPYKHSPSLHGGVQLLYSLRSIEKYLIGFDSLYIVGDIHPNINANYIPFVDNLEQGFKDANIYQKCAKALDYVSNGRGLMLNDDHYILAPYDVLYYPFFYREGDMIKTIEKHVDRSEGTGAVMGNTREFLLEKGATVRNYDVHCPIIYEKEAFKALESADWTKPNGYGVKSLYCNLNKVKGTFIEDNKMFPHMNEADSRNAIKNHPFFSTSPLIRDHQMKILQELYPEKSHWEK